MSDVLQALRDDGPDRELESEALGRWLLSAAGLDAPEGLITVAPAADARRVPWARDADWVIVPTSDGIALISLAGARVEPGFNLAGEERDLVVLDEAQLVARGSLGDQALLLRGALVRVALMAGALERIASMSIAHARDRRQFGRAIGSFQAVQAHLVTIAQQAAVVGVAADAALARGTAFEIACAKLLANSAATVAARAAHQVHGAVGVTREHPLGIETRRLWAWRCEYGSERVWSTRLGIAAASAGAEALYPAITGGSGVLEL